MKKILIIEDDFFVSKIYARTFEMAGYDVATARDGEEGLRSVGAFKPDLVQLDLVLPKLSGVDVLKAIRANPALSSLPVLVISSGYNTSLIKEAWQAGATKVIAKTECSPKIVLERVETLLVAAAPTQPVPAPASSSARSASEPAGAVPQFHPGLEASPTMAMQVVRQAFLKRAPQIEGDLRNRLRAVIRNDKPNEQRSCLYELCWSVHGLVGHAGLTGLIRISHLADALEVLLKELYDNPALVTPSTLRTIAHAVDCLGQLFAQSPHPHDEFSRCTLIMAVDDDQISLRILRNALAKAHLMGVCLNDPEIALNVLKQNHFDLIFLDGDMPKIDGFELCRQLRTFSANATTPVVFVTSLADFPSRAKSISSGATDLIAKPFPLIELAVKTLTYLVQTPLSAPVGHFPPTPASS